MLLIVTALKLCAEIALMAMAGKWVLGLVAGVGRDRNVFYRLLGLVAAPFVAVVGRVMHRILPGRRVPLAAFLVLAVLWVGLTATKIGLCLRAGADACR